MATNKYINQLSGITNPSLTGFTAFDNQTSTYKVSLGTLRQTLVDSGSHYFTGSQTINGNLVVSGSITAQQYVVSSSLINVTNYNVSGSSIFGNTLDDLHQFTGSLNITGSLVINGSSFSAAASGTSGTSGSSGSSGTSGSNGSSGTSGGDGTNGTSGSSGSSGTSGESGTSGSNGTSGTSGADGVSGSSGTSGVDGESGTSVSLYEEVTYSELYSYLTGATLTPGKHYLMTDFQTCYDQPNYDSYGNTITTDNYKTGTTEPMLLLATSTTGFSPTVCSTLYPQDKISYDITWNLTEVTSGPAKGRITERIDNVNNRADYDFRAVQFIRYVGYFSEQFYNGKITLDNSNGQVIASETGTTFTSDFTVGDIFGVYDPYGSSSLGSFRYYEISSIVSNDEMYVTGRTLSSATNVYYSSGVRLPNYMSPFQCNITGTTNDEFAEYYTFDDDSNYNTYLGNYTDYNTFILSNNVFLNGDYKNNTFGGNVVGNTFSDDMDSNIIGPYCQFNIITNDFDRNIIGSYFQSNIIVIEIIVFYD